MKSYLLTNVLFLLCLGSLFGQKNEEAAIQKLLENETEAFTKMSLADVVKTYWVMDDKTVANVTMPDGNHIHMILDDLLSQNIFSSFLSKVSTLVLSEVSQST